MMHNSCHKIKTFGISYQALFKLHVLNDVHVSINTCIL